MSNRKNVRAGAFVVISLVLLAFVVIVFGGLRFWEREDTYRIEFSDSVRGLEEGAYVYFEGIRVGSVSEIELGTTSRAKVVVTIAVEAGTPIRTDTHALLQFAGITGLKVIDLEAGDLSAPRLPDGGTIAQGQTVLDKFERTAEDVADQSTRLMQRANQLVDNLATITEPSQFASLQEILANARQLTASLARATARLDKMVASSRVGSLVTTADKTLASADTLIGRLDAMVRVNEGPLRSAVFDLRQASRNFKELAREIRQRPSRLLFAPTPRERKLP